MILGLPMNMMALSLSRGRNAVRGCVDAGGARTAGGRLRARAAGNKGKEASTSTQAGSGQPGCVAASTRNRGSRDRLPATCAFPEPACNDSPPLHAHAGMLACGTSAALHLAASLPNLLVFSPTFTFPVLSTWFNWNQPVTTLIFNSPNAVEPLVTSSARHLCVVYNCSASNHVF